MGIYMWKKWWNPSRNDLLLNLLNEWWPLRMLYSLLERRAWTLRARTASISLHFIFSLSPDFDMSSSSMSFSVQASSVLSTPKRLITSLSRRVPNPVALSSNVTYSTSLCFNPTVFLLLRSLRKISQIHFVLFLTLSHAPQSNSDVYCSLSNSLSRSAWRFRCILSFSGRSVRRSRYFQSQIRL